MMDFQDALRLERERGSPVRQAVARNWPRISKARSEGVPLDQIYRALKRTGEAVGKGPSSFRAAVKFWDEQGSPIGEPRGPKPTTTPPPATATEDRTRFADVRFSSDF